MLGLSRPHGKEGIVRKDSGTEFNKVESLSNTNNSLRFSCFVSAESGGSVSWSIDRFTVRRSPIH